MTNGSSGKCELREALRLATQLFGSYRASDANNPEQFIADTARTFALYPQDIAEKVADPIRGLPSKNTFLPSIAEIRKALEVEMVWFDAVVRRQLDRAHSAKILEPHVPSPSERERVKAGFRDLVDEMAIKAPARKDRPPDIRHARTPEAGKIIEAHWDAHVEKLTAEYAARPLVVSGELSGQAPPPDDDEREAS